ncbi:5,6-dimethylbenzimidazole synthase [Mycobacterium sp. NPDC048908]|uniref:5,6-dimethylbenzimidazole synthase n=1 Tax=Mycobacterium sp. NPDC048908 TaxID=3364292 RepID=UPI003720CC84
MTEHAFSAAERNAVYRAITERRDMRRFLPNETVPDDVLTRLLQAAHAAPSVGLMQPWRFIRITDAGLTRIHAIIDDQRLCTAVALGPRGDEFLTLKVEGILECAELLVVALGPCFRQAHAAPDGPRVGVVRDQNLWLAARAEGLGMGWVSIFDRGLLGALLAMPPDAQPVAILCLGPVPDFPTRPQLGIDHWTFGRPLGDFVAENGWPAATPA